ncbi:MAG TPA: helix-turn-helix domain-containing protein [Polyangiaceae bacterium]|jgi:predicted ArsR family transcriptional regulator
MFSPRTSQQAVLDQLLEHKSGATLDELVASLGLSRTAVNQQLIGLERDGYVRKAASRKTGGRPVYVYVLTEEGANRFPKQYSWFSKLLIQTLRDRLGEQEAGQYMFDLGIKMSADLIPRLVGKDRPERLAEIVQIMNETGFVARTVSAQGADKLQPLEFKNCVYHDLSKDYPEVCRFDIGFLSGLMGSDVEHQECMQRGGGSCRFRFLPK